VSTNQREHRGAVRRDVVAADVTLSELIRAVMDRRGLTLQSVAERGGLSISAVATLRSGVRGKRPRLATLQRLAAGLGVDEDVVFAAARAVHRQDAEREAQLLRGYRALAPSDRGRVDELVRRLAGG
jgi:transcriptional regulator with XRE-family HTH domain